MDGEGRARVDGMDITGGDPRWAGTVFRACPVAAAAAPWVGEVWQRATLAVGPEGGGLGPAELDDLTPAMGDAIYTVLVERAALRAQQMSDQAADMQRGAGG